MEAGRTHNCDAASFTPFVPGVQMPPPFTLVIFARTGDLVARKLLLRGCKKHLFAAGYLPEQFGIVGVGRRDKSDDAFRRRGAKVAH